MCSSCKMHGRYLIRFQIINLNIYFSTVVIVVDSYFTI